MVGKNTSGSITFYYDNEQLFNDTGILSAYMAKNFDVEGSVDKFSISDDEKDVFNICVKQALPDIYETILKMTSCITNAFTSEKVIDMDETTGLKRKAGSYVEISINNNDAYNENTLAIVDETLYMCIKYGALAQFYSTCLQMDLYRIAQDRFVSNLRMLNQRLFQLKRKIVSSLLA